MSTTMNAVISLTFVLFSLCLFNFVSSHGHSHDEPSEPAASKYSKQVNEAAAAKGPKIVDKSHSHSHSHDDNNNNHHSHHQHEHVHAHSHGSHSHSGDSHDDHSQDSASEGHIHDKGHGHSHGSPSDRSFKATDTPKAVGGFDGWLWAKAITATALISVAPVFILLLIPVENANDDRHKPLLKVLLAFASGGLLGDAFLHLIPHAVSPHSHVSGEEHGHSHTAPADNSHGHSHGAGGHDMTVGLWVLAGIIAFLCVEKFVRLVKGDHTHSHSHSDAKPADSKEEVKEDSTENKEESPDKPTEPSKPIETNKPAEGKESLKIAGYLNLAADFAHNFTDGLAIGASFLAGESVGLITTVTILLHEVPHEIGDFAILVQSGCSKRKAMMLQFTTAIGAMCGTLLSLTAGGLSTEATLWVLPFTAGGFIYIATVSVIPELLENTKLGQSIKEVAALLIGVYMMVLIAQYE